MRDHGTYTATLAPLACLDDSGVLECAPSGCVERIATADGQLPRWYCRAARPASMDNARAVRRYEATPEQRVALADSGFSRGGRRVG